MSAGTVTTEAWVSGARLASANHRLVLLALAHLEDHYGQRSATPGQVSRLTPFAESTTAGALRRLAGEGLVIRHRLPHQRVAYTVRRNEQGARP